MLLIMDSHEVQNKKNSRVSDLWLYHIFLKVTSGDDPFFLKSSV